MFVKKINTDQLQEISKILQKYLEENKLSLKEVKFSKNEFIPESNDLVLQIFISNCENKNVALKEIIGASRLLNKELENSNNFNMTELSVEVSSSGIETVINSLTELESQIEKEIYVSLENGNDYQGKLLEINNEEIIIKVNFKGQFRKVKFSYNEANLIRRAISAKKEINN